MSTDFQDRIVELRSVRAGDLQAHPLNWRGHPRKQRKALEAALEEIGFADALVARELEDGSLQLVDGHLRHEVVDLDTELPVLVVDLSDEEAAKVLVTMDPIGAMASTDQRKL